MGDDQRGGSSTENGETFEQRLQTAMAAAQTLGGWIAGAQNFALLCAAVDVGVVDALRQRRTAAEIGEQCGLSPERAEALCFALTARGVCDKEGDCYRLAPDFVQLSGDGGMQRLSDTLDGADVVIRTLGRLSDPAGAYTAMPPADLLAMAYSSSARAELPLARAFFEALARAMPEVKLAWENGGRHLELGCGIGGTLLGPALVFPRLTGVGVEIDPTIVEHVRGRAMELGLSDRIEIRQGDARDFGEEGSFDTALWSQTFFPADTRAPTLLALHRALVDDGLLVMPILFGNPPQTPEALREPSGRAFTLNRLVYGHWSVPLMGSKELQDEAAIAGFSFVREATTPVARYLVLRKS